MDQHHSSGESWLCWLNDFSAIQILTLTVAATCGAAGVVFIAAFGVAEIVVSPCGPATLPLASYLMVVPMLVTMILAAAVVRRFGGQRWSLQALFTAAVVMTWGVVVLPRIPQELGGMRPDPFDDIVGACWIGPSGG